MLITTLLFALHPVIAMPQSDVPAILPKPQSIHSAGGSGFEITSETVLIDDAHTKASSILNAMLAKSAGFRLRSGSQSTTAGSIRFEKLSKDAVKPEGYELHVGTGGITIGYADSAGALYGVETLRQLLPSAIESSNVGNNVRWQVPAVDVTDYPRFPWRGMHLDVSRHFFPAPFIKKYIDYLAFMKMNVFHWHLVDDGGWRLQIEKYPKLTSVGAWRYGITTGWDQSKLRFDPSSKLPKYGGFYTKKEVRDIVKYAADRNITIVPEIEMPGHTMPVLAAYPELMCKNQKPAALTGQPDSNVYCAGSDKSYEFVQNVLDEVMELFPSQWIHIGGDEVDKVYWKACSVCQEKIHQEGLKNEEELQSYFVRKIDKYLASKGRRLIGWDEILEGGLAKGATVMSWRGIDGGIAAAKAGHDVVMSPYSHAYFDASNTNQPIEHVYSFDPVPPALNEEEAKHVLGGQANVWTEWIPTTQRVEYMIFPRITGMSEALWSPKEGKDIHDFMNRVPMVFDRLDRMGANFYIPAPRVEMNALIFKDQARIAAIQERGTPGTLRYTIDGKLPTGSSPEYTGAFSVNRPTKVTLAYVTKSGITGTPVQVSCAPAGAAAPANLAPGWKMAYYEGQWTALPDFTKLTPKKTMEMDHIGVDGRDQENDFGMVYTGYFKAESDGVYRFTLGSDDGSSLKVGDLLVIDNDGLHSAIPKEGTVWLPKGLHKIDVNYFQQREALSLKLLVQTPGTANPTPADSFIYHPQ